MTRISAVATTIATTVVLKSRYNQPRDELDLSRGYVPGDPPSPGQLDDREE